MRKRLSQIALLVAGFGAGMFVTNQFLPQQATAKQLAEPLPLKELRLLSEIYGLVKRDYVEPVKGSELLTDAIKGMVGSLDPHSEYLDEKAFDDLREQTQGRFAGLGIEITESEGAIKVIAPIEDSPAAKAGIKSGDLITRIDSKSVRSLTLQQAIKRMRGEPGSKVTLTIFRRSEERTFPVVIVRDVIKVQTVKTKMIKPTIGWVRITSFQERTVHDLSKKLNNLIDDNPTIKGLVLDLRSNGGGLLQSAVGVSAVFLPKQKVVVSTKGQAEHSEQVYRTVPSDYMLITGLDMLADLNEKVKTIPLVVLTNAYSASASEIVAGALQDHKRATIMGKTTYGKGSVQTVQRITDKTGLRLTTAYYYTPSGKSIQSFGVRPDLIVDQFADGDPDEAYITREVDMVNHLKNKQKNEEDDLSPLDELRRLEILRIEEENRKNPNRERENREKVKAEFEHYGDEKDFMLKQAVNFLEGQPVVTSKSKIALYNPAKDQPKKPQ